MSTWDVVNLITVIGVILAPITTFVFLANSLFHISSAMRKYGTDNQLLANQLAQKDTLLAYLLSQAVKNGGFNQQGARKQEEYVEYACSNSDFYTPSSAQLVVANKQAELRNAQAQVQVPIFRNSGFWIGVLSGLCVFLATSLFFVMFLR